MSSKITINIEDILKKINNSICNSDPEKSYEDLGMSLEDYQRQRYEQKIDNMERKLQVKLDLHALRKSQASYLLWIAIAWMLTITFLVLLQGLEASPYSEYRFNLPSSVLIAFITSTTTAVLGLYGISAYWLYSTTSKKNNNNNGKNKKNSRNKKSI